MDSRETRRRKQRQRPVEQPVFAYDVFLSHSSKDKEVVREIADLLRGAGLRVWFDEWELQPGDHISMRIEEGLQQSRVLVLCMSENAIDSEWVGLESHTYRFRDPLNRSRRFIPVRLDSVAPPVALRPFQYVDWRPRSRGTSHRRLLEACGAKDDVTSGVRASATPDSAEPFKHSVGQSGVCYGVAFRGDGTRALFGYSGGIVRLLDVETGRQIRVMEGHGAAVNGVAFSRSGTRALSGADDNTVRLWNVETGQQIHVMEGHTGDEVYGVALSGDGTRALSGGDDGTVRLWNTETGRQISVMEGHDDAVYGVALSGDGIHAISGSDDDTVRLWNLQTGQQVHVMNGHHGFVYGLAFTGDGTHALYGAADGTVQLWNVQTGQQVRVMEGHTGAVWCVALSGDGTRALSGADDGTVRLWNTETGQQINVMDGHSDAVYGVGFNGDGSRALSGTRNGVLRVWPIGGDLRPLDDALPSSRQYTNAKVLLVGNSSAGKTGLSRVLAGEPWTPSDSTVGAWSTRWPLPVETDDGIEKEIWLWDFGGQADQRLIHQLYMDQTQVAALIFDPQKPELLEGLATWDRDLSRAATGSFEKLLVAGRIDAGGLRHVSRQRVEEFARERGFASYVETSAKEGTNCEELRGLIVKSINWDEITKRTSPGLFRQLKNEILALKDEGRILMRFNELRDALVVRMGHQRFSDDELSTVIRLLSGPGVVWEFGFGSWILLAPELVNAYAQAVIRTVQEDERELGCITEETVLAGKLCFPQKFDRLPEDDERILLLAMHRMLVENNLCISESTESGTLLVFPSYARRERPVQVQHPSVQVSYQFEGFLDDVYATLVVRLHRTGPFKTTDLWNGAADFQNENGQQLGIKLTRRAAGQGELLVYFDQDLPVGERMMFSRYVQEHLYRKVRNHENVKRLRHWMCDKCGEPVKNRERAMQRLSDDGNKARIICVNCEEYVSLWDEMEVAFADPDLVARVRALEDEAERSLDSESKERSLVGEVISTVALAGQISREFPVSDHGIDMEIEFKDDKGAATGRRLYLQLKSGDSHLTTRKRDGAEIFKISKQRHLRYWMQQAYPVFLVIRSSNGDIRWMEIRDHLKEVTNDGAQQVRQIEFDGERFDVMSVRRWRDSALHV